MRTAESGHGTIKPVRITMLHTEARMLIAYRVKMPACHVTASSCVEKFLKGESKCYQGNRLEPTDQQSQGLRTVFGLEAA